MKADNGKEFSFSRSVLHEKIARNPNILNSRSRKRRGYMTPKENINY